MAMLSPPLGLSEMPPEIKEHICEFLCDHCRESWKVLRRTTDTPITHTPLRNLCRTSKSLKAVAEPILYHFFCGGGELEESRPSLTRFLGVVMTRPELAKCVKSLSIDGSNECGVKRDEMFLDLVLRGVDMNQRAAQLEESFRHNFIFANSIIQHAKKIQELEISVGQSWEGMHVELVDLKELSIHSAPQDGILSSRLILPFLQNSPKLKKLTLSNFAEFGDYESDAMVNIKQLTLIHTNTFELPALRKLLKGTPNLQSFKFWNPAIDMYDGESIFRVLLPRRDSLTSLTIDGLLFSGNCAALEQLLNLETLDMSISASLLISNMDSLKFPKSLKRLVLRASEMHEFTLVIKALGQRLHKFPQLENVDVVLIIYKGRMMKRKLHDPSRWVGDAEKDFRKASVHLSAHILDRDQDAMRRDILGRCWGKNIRGRRYTDPALVE